MLFAEAEREEARRLLQDDCADNLFGMQVATPEHLERIRYAALKLSKGSIPGLVDAIVLAQTDWRDLLVVAEFAEDIRAHESWLPKDY